MNQAEFVEFLWRHGHFWGPAASSFGVEEKDLPALKADDAAVAAAAASLCESDANADVLFGDLRGRIGDLAVARVLATLPRCPVPDHAPPPGVRSADPDLDAVIRSMQESAAAGSGSWPAGCHGTPGVHEVKISYDLSRLTQKHREWWPEIKRRSHQAVADVGVKLIEVEPGDRSANITVYGKVLPGSTIGMAQFNSQRCGDVVFCQLDPGYAPDIDMVLNLLLHENGHNWNLEHRRGNIMNPSILRTPAVWVKREGGRVVYEDNSYPTLKRYFGGEPIEGPPPSPPPPPDPPPVTGVRLVLPGGGYLTADYPTREITYPTGWTGRQV